MNVALIGFMGCGKSTVGLLLAKALGRKFIDLDVEIETAGGESINHIFAARGEVFFRALEAEALARACATPKAVIATGGGTVKSPANAALLRATCRVVYLRATAAQVCQSVEGDTTRPLLAGAGPEQIAALLAERAPFYEACAHLVVDRGEKNAAEVLREILGAL
jgi:shikimate kinase